MNLYDVRKTCDRDPSKDGPLCYPKMQAIEAFMNKPEIKKELGVPAKVDFQSCNMQVNQLFEGDWYHFLLNLVSLFKQALSLPRNCS